MYPYRVFVCYSHADEELAERLIEHMRRMGLCAGSDRSNTPGPRFADQIKHAIAHAHVFVPILTENSVTRPWVHQETGYAMGLEVPVLPLAVGQLPAGMMSDLQAMRVSGDFEDLSSERLGQAIERLPAGEPAESAVTFRCAELPETRAELLARYMREALAHEASGPFRQSGALTSFCLPTEPESDPIWREREAPVMRGELLHRRYREERLAIEEYVRHKGCTLAIAPSIRPKEYTPAALRIRLCTLLEFLTDDTVRDVRVAVRGRPDRRNLTIGGDWFVAETITPRPGKGYYQTNFTWHAPAVLDRLQKFDRDFELLLKRAGVTEASSREAAILAVEREIAGIGQ